ncbi:hypothetical protein THASP1DRAFT_19544, partial [Thamnocephalis sphaerospora]
TVRSFDRPTYDISPVVTTFRRWGDNASLNMLQLTQKLCWLLAICGFIRPSDVARIDDICTVRTDLTLKLVVVVPKEKRNGQRIEKVISVTSHRNPVLCPVTAYTAYRARFDSNVSPAQHPIPSDLEYSPLVQSLRGHQFAVGSPRISKHINAIMALIPVPVGASLPKACTLGSTHAAFAGASWKDILTQGFWASTGVFDTFYRLARSTQANLTELSFSAPTSL